MAKADPIIKRAVNAQKRIAECKEIIQACETEIRGCFKSLLGTSKLVTPAGIATFTLRRSWSANISDPEIAKATLKDDFARVFDEKRRLYVPEDKIDSLIEKLGFSAQSYVREELGFAVQKTFQNLVKADERSDTDNELLKRALPFYEVRETESVKFEPIE